MSIALLVQVYDETRRLAIAGAAVASGDFRLKKLIGPLGQAGAKAPVFARVAQAVQAIVQGDEKTASASLLDLATLVNAILQTQGETGITGELKPIETTDLGAPHTQSTARVLKPLFTALQTTGSGRIELIRDAVERGTFKDLRMVQPALNALDDSYPEIASLIAAKVLPLYGRAIVPALRAKLDLNGRAGHVHRLHLLHMLDPEGSREIVRQALDVGSKEIRVAAVECLDTTGDDLGYLLEQVRSKAKDVRAAALRALAGAQSPGAEITAALKVAIDGADLSLMVDRLKENPCAEVRDYVVVRSDKQLSDTLAERDPKKQGPAVERLMHLVRCLEGRTDAQAQSLLVRCFELVPALCRIKSAPSGNDFNEMLALVMSRCGAALQKRLAAAHKTLSGEMLPPAYTAARRTMAPAAFFAEFSPVLSHLSSKGGKKSAEADRAHALARVLTADSDHSEYQPWATRFDPNPPHDEPLPELDPRWLDTAVSLAAVELVCALAVPNHAKTQKFLLAQLDSAKPADQLNLLATMVRIKHPAAADAIIESLKRQAKTAHFGYNMYWYSEMITELPKSEFPKFEAALASMPEKMVDLLIEPITELKNKPD